MSKFDLPASLVKRFVSQSVKRTAPAVAHTGAFDESAFATAFQQLQKAAPKTVLPGTNHQDTAKELGIIFNGMQKWPKLKDGTQKPDMPYFTDPVTKSTFGVYEGESVLENLKRMRKTFGVE